MRVKVADMASVFHASADGHRVVGATVVRLAPPLALVSSEVGDGRSRIIGRTLRTSVRIEGQWSDDATLDLPVPVPSERRQASTDREDLAGTMRVESRLAALEVGRAPTPSDLGDV
jgi:hypothetical protein